MKQPFDPEKVVLVVKEGIEFYNQKPHKALYGMSPNYMEKALFIHSKAVNFIDKEGIQGYRDTGIQGYNDTPFNEKCTQCSRFTKH